MKDIEAILRLTYAEGLSVREVAERLRIGRTSVSTYLLRAREAGIAGWPPPEPLEEAGLEPILFKRMGRPPRDLSEPDWAAMSRELKRKGVTRTLLWQEYRAAHPDGYGYTWFCEGLQAFEHRRSPSFRNRFEAGAVMQTDYAGHTMPVTRCRSHDAGHTMPVTRCRSHDAGHTMPVTRCRSHDAGHTMPVFDLDEGRPLEAQIFVAVLGASSYTFAYASFSQALPDWIEGQCRALAFFGGVTKSIVCDNLKAGVAKAIWFEPTLNATFAAMAEHYNTTILPTRVRKPRDKAKVEGAVLIVERWILARLRNRRFFSLAELNVAIRELLDDLNNRPMRHAGQSRRQLFEAVERDALSPLPAAPFEYAEWKTAKVHPDYHVDVERTVYSVPHGLIGQKVDVRLTHRVVEIFHDHKRVASHVRRSARSGHVTVNEHMPKAHQRYANTTPESLMRQAAQIGANTAILVERLMRDRPHPEQGYRSAMGVISLARRFDKPRLEAACERALTINAISYSSVNAILKSGLDRAKPSEPVRPSPPHGNIRGNAYYQ